MFMGLPAFTVHVGAIAALGGGYTTYEDPTHNAVVYIRRITPATGNYLSFYIRKTGGL